MYNANKKCWQKIIYLMVLNGVRGVRTSKNFWVKSFLVGYYKKIIDIVTKSSKNVFYLEV